MRKAIVLNGPPNSGKDAIADMMASIYGVRRAAFKTALYHLCAQVFEVPVEWLLDVATNRSTKDSIRYNEFNGRTPREALIHVSENIIKPCAGNDIFGHLILDSMKEPGIYVVSDGGFEEEIKPLMEELDDVVIIHLEREGCSFDGDSRDYITAGYPITYVNNDTLEHAAIDIMRLANGV